MVCVPAPPDSRGVRVAGSGFSVATLAAQNPAAFPVVSPGQENAGQAPLGQFLVPFGSPRNAELQPQSLRFPRGRKPRVIRPGALPCPLSHVPRRIAHRCSSPTPPRLRPPLLPSPPWIVTFAVASAASPLPAPPPPYGESQTSSSIRTSLPLLGFLLSIPLTGPCRYRFGQQLVVYVELEEQSSCVSREQGRHVLAVALSGEQVKQLRSRVDCCRRC
jgi:hypothetical protein